jgi:hypothetical protein
LTSTSAQGEPSRYLSDKFIRPRGHAGQMWGPRQSACVFGLAVLLGVPVSFAAEASPPSVRLSGRAELDRIVELYHSGQYESCRNDLEDLVAREKTPGAPVAEDAAVSERARLYLATCALMLGDDGRARAVLRDALEQNPLMASPDSLSFPPPLVALFLQVRDEVKTLIAKREAEEVERLRAQSAKTEAESREREKRERALLELASQETLVAQSSRIVAFLPFGAGQYQNGAKPLGDFFLVTELGVGIISGVSGLILLDLYRQTLQVDPGANDNSKFQAAYTVFAVSSWTWVGLVTLGALEANLNFQKTRVLGVRKRQLPTLAPRVGLTWPKSPISRAEGFRGPEIMPYGGPLNDGFFFGFQGTF